MILLSHDLHLRRQSSSLLYLYQLSGTQICLNSLAYDSAYRSKKPGHEEEEAACRDQRQHWAEAQIWGKLQKHFLVALKVPKSTVVTHGRSVEQPGLFSGQATQENSALSVEKALIRAVTKKSLKVTVVDLQKKILSGLD